jgi:hypothetical protein
MRAIMREFAIMKLIPAVIMLWTTPVHTQLVTCGCFRLLHGRYQFQPAGDTHANLTMRVCFLLSQQQLRPTHESELTNLTYQSAICWDIMQCSLVVLRCFTTSQCLYFHGLRVRKTRSQEKRVAYS